MYDRLGIKGLNERGESFYNPLLPDLVESLMQNHIAEESEGAKVVFVRVRLSLHQCHAPAPFVLHSDQQCRQRCQQQPSTAPVAPQLAGPLQAEIVVVCCMYSMATLWKVSHVVVCVCHVLSIWLSFFC